MVGNLLKKMVGLYPLSKSHKEFLNIMELEDKRFNLQGHYGTINKEVQLQKEILINNILTLAHLYDEIEKPNLIRDLNKGEYFNIQGTKPRLIVLKDGDIQSEYHHKATKTKTYTYVLSEAKEIKKNLIGLELKFLDLPLYPFKSSVVLEKIKKVAKTKMHNKIKAFSLNFKGNESLVEEFLTKDIDNKIELSMERTLERLHFIISFMGSLSYILDSENISIDNKKLVEINLQDFSKISEATIKLFLTNFVQHTYDYIII